MVRVSFISRVQRKKKTFNMAREEKKKEETSKLPPVSHNHNISPVI